MACDISTPDYYRKQGMIAELYGINDHHAGCYITHFPASRVCVGCHHARKCEEILERELHRKDA